MMDSGKENVQPCVPSATTGGCSETSPKRKPAASQKFHFQIREDISLLKEVVSASAEKPFARGSPAWNTILANLCTNYDPKWKCVSTRTLRDRTTLIVEAYIRTDNYKKRQTGTNDEYTEKDQLLEEVKSLFQLAKEGEQDAKEMSASAAAKKEEDKRTVANMRAKAMERLGGKRPADSPPPAPAKQRVTVADVMAKRQEDRREVRERELTLQEKQAEQRDRELMIQERELEERSRAAKAREEYDKRVLELLAVAGNAGDKGSK